MAGMRIRYRGYVSIVAPDYGSKLPSLNDTSILMATSSSTFVELQEDRIYVTPERLS
jgi:hypothetical protein